MRYTLTRYREPSRTLKVERGLLLACCLFLLAGWAWTTWQYVKLAEASRLSAPVQRGHP